jgi:hypothetical protein
MKIFEADITYQVSDFFIKMLKRIALFESANDKMMDVCGIHHYFNNQKEYEVLKNVLSKTHIVVKEPDRTEYGDFQTNNDLAVNVATYLKHKSANPKIILEPTCGKGSFIIASLRTFDRIEKIFAIDIYMPYVWETKFSILQYFIDNPSANKPEIVISHFNVFDFDFTEISKEYTKEEILIIGNPPWVTNSKLSRLDSTNLPAKSNFKKHNGIDAITGKGNFDIGEYITLRIFDAFQNSNGYFAFLVKNSVIKNIIYDQKQRNFKISDIQKLSIDSKKEFNVSVEASLLICKLKQVPEFICNEYNIYAPSKLINKFGWVDDKFVSSIALYQHSSGIDGICPFEWRQGIKHDLSSFMELERVNGHFVNGLNQKIILEEDLVFGLLKSSDLKQTVIDKTRKYTIVTQKKVGQSTAFIKKDHPKTYNYLYKNKSQFDLWRSSIYKGKPDYSIFGIGDYSFKPFKIAISGLYKKYSFNLVVPQNGKPIMLDDTCYLLGFDRLDYAAYTFILLNSEKTKKLLKAITFPDAKRMFTKDVLMRIDLMKLAMQTQKAKIKNDIDELNTCYNLKIQTGTWNEYIATMRPQQTEYADAKQLTLLEPIINYKRTVA